MPTFLQQDGSFFPPQNVTIAPATGSTVRLGSGHTFVQQAGTLAALTVRMPSSPKPGQVISLTPGAAITALTVVTDSGAAISGAPTAGVANTRINMLWNGTVWARQL